MDNMTPPPSETAAGAQVTVDLSQVELTDEEVNALLNKITRLAAESVRQQAADVTVARRPREPYVKITFVKAIPPPPR
jgi:hypothetical protein